MYKGLLSKNAWGNINLWLCIAFLVRMYAIHFPPLDGAYNWRESDVLTVARNFLEIDSNIFYPRINIAGDKSGITGMEFPLFNYLIFLLSFLGGPHYLYGRLLNLSFATLAIFFYYRTLREHLEAKLAFYSALLLLFSLWFSFSRKIVPDIFSNSLVIIAIYYGLGYLQRGKHYFYVIAYALCLSLGILAKIPSALLCSVFILPIVGKRAALGSKLVFIAFSLGALAPALFWYYYWVPYLNSTYGFEYFFMGKPLSVGIQEILKNFFGDLSETFYKESMGYSGFLLYLWGIWRSIRNKKRVLIYVWIVSICACLFFLANAGGNIHHDYYILWWIPSMTLLSAYGLSQIQHKKIALFILIFVCSENIISRQHHFHIPKEKRMAMLELESIFEKISDKEELIIINSGSDPQAMYFTRRRGWLANNEELADANFRSKFKSKGCKYILILKKVGNEGDLKLKLPQIIENQNFRVYKL